MSEPESFAASAQPPPQAADAAPALEKAAGAQAGSDRTDASSEAPFDPESLPPIDSITAGSDIKAFLQAGVPRDLTRAALRRAWTADPAIRDFIGLAENQWDFTDPTAMPGFGPLEASDDIRQLVAQAMGRLAESPKARGTEEVALGSEGAQEPDRALPETPAALQTDNATPEEKASLLQEHVPEEHRHGAEVGDVRQVTSARQAGEINDRRIHGSALPK
jgi:hypothetical protein